MDFNSYEKEAMKTASSQSRSITVAALGLSGESGEISDRVKKYISQGHPLGIANVLEELGDILWYVALAADYLGVPMEEIAHLNLIKLKKRYPNGFEAERSLNRDV